MATTHSNRIEKLREVLLEEGLDALFLTSPVSMGYLMGFHEGGGERFLTLAVHSSGEMRMICPALSETQARRHGIEHVSAWRDGEDPLALFAHLARDWKLDSGVLAVEDEMRAAMLLDMQSVLPAALFRKGQETISRLMRNKEQSELEKMQRAADIADAAYPAGLAAIRAGATERDVQDALVAEMKRLGGEPTFCIVATGKNGAEPHHLTDDTVIREGDVVITDFGCHIGGYNSDITRTAACGDAGDEAGNVYRVVYEAQAAARAAIRPGVSCEEIDAAARKVIDGAGYGEYFVHRTGHGIGLRIHEEPYIVHGNTETLAPGNCFSVEPGIYLPGRFGVRIENIVTVNEQGHHSFNAEPSPDLLNSLR
jgi:Xaa-Pro dipeptidase